MIPLTSAAGPSGPRPRWPIGARLARVAALAVVLALVVVLVVALFLAWLAGDAPDLYAHAGAGIHRLTSC